MIYLHDLRTKLSYSPPLTINFSFEQATGRKLIFSLQSKLILIIGNWIPRSFKTRQPPWSIQTRITMLSLPKQHRRYITTHPFQFYRSLQRPLKTSSEYSHLSSGRRTEMRVHKSKRQNNLYVNTDINVTKVLRKEKLVKRTKK